MIRQPVVKKKNETTSEKEEDGLMEYIKCSSESHLRLKALAVQRKAKMQDLAEEALIQYLDGRTVMVPPEINAWSTSDPAVAEMPLQELAENALDLYRVLLTEQLRVICSTCSTEQIVEKQGDIYAGVPIPEQITENIDDTDAHVIVLKAPEVGPPELIEVLASFIDTYFSGGKGVVSLSAQICREWARKEKGE